MELVKKEVEVSKAASEVAEHSIALLVAIYAALKDGFQAGQDLSAIISALVVNSPDLFANVGKLGADFGEDKEAFIMAFLVELPKVYDAIAKKSA